MLVTLGSFCVPVFIFSYIIHSGGYDPIWCCLFEPHMLKKCIHSHQVPSSPSNSQISQGIPSDSKKLFGISWNVLDFSVWFSFSFEFLGIHSHYFLTLEFLGILKVISQGFPNRPTWRMWHTRSCTNVAHCLVLYHLYFGKRGRQNQGKLKKEMLSLQSTPKVANSMSLEICWKSKNQQGSLHDSSNESDGKMFAR